MSDWLSVLRAGTTPRETIKAALRTQTPLTQAQNSAIAMAFGLGLQGGKYQNHNDPPPGRTVVCILALMERIEELEQRIAALERPRRR